MQITIPSIIRAIQERPRAEWEEEEKEPRPEPAALVVNHIATKRIEHKEMLRQRAEEAARTAEEENQAKAAELMRQIGSDIETPVAAAGVPAPKVEYDEILPITNELEPVPETMPELEVDKISEPAPVKDEPQPEKPKKVKVQKVTKQDAEDSAEEVAKEIAQAEKIEKPVYCFPPINLLKLPSGGILDGTAEMRENTRRLNETLASFKIEAHIINVTRGPSVTR